MSNKYQLLADLEALHRNNGISEEEYQRERQKIMSTDPQQCYKSNDLGMEENTYLMLMHLSQFAGIIIPLGGYIVPIIMWAINKDKNKNVDRHGKNILNFIISWIIYFLVAFILAFVIIGIPILIILAVLSLVFIIMAAVKANSNEFWKYPMCIPFFSVD